jgi:DNA-binding SARP family transcriptional activator
MLEFRILGPTEVWNEDEQLQLGGPKQRAVLALLLLEAGRVVSTDRLIDLLWGGRRRHCGVASIRIG